MRTIDRPAGSPPFSEPPAFFPESEYQVIAVVLPRDTITLSKNVVFTSTDPNEAEDAFHKIYAELCKQDLTFRLTLSQNKVPILWKKNCSKFGSMMAKYWLDSWRPGTKITSSLNKAQ